MFCDPSQRFRLAYCSWPGAPVAAIKEKLQQGSHYLWPLALHAFLFAIFQEIPFFSLWQVRGKTGCCPKKERICCLKALSRLSNNRKSVRQRFGPFFVAYFWKWALFLVLFRGDTFLDCGGHTVIWGPFIQKWDGNSQQRTFRNGYHRLPWVFRTFLHLQVVFDG